MDVDVDNDGVGADRIDVDGAVAVDDEVEVAGSNGPLVVDVDVAEADVDDEVEVAGSTWSSRCGRDVAEAVVDDEVGGGWIDMDGAIAVSSSRTRRWWWLSTRPGVLVAVDVVDVVLRGKRGRGRRRGVTWPLSLSSLCVVVVVSLSSCGRRCCAVVAVVVELAWPDRGHLPRGHSPAVDDDDGGGWWWGGRKCDVA